MYAIVENGSVVEYPVDLRSKYPQTSFPTPLPDHALPDGVVRVYTGSVPEHDHGTHKVVLGTPVFQDGAWIAPYTVIPLSDAELSAMLAGEAFSVRANRNALLQQSDWTQLADAQVDRAAWAAYRQALRDVPSQDGFPRNVNWPTKPE